MAYRIGYYMCSVGLKHGGVFNYSKCILRLLLGGEAVGAVRVYYTRKQKDALRECLDHPKVIPVLVRRGLLWRIRHSLSKTLFRIHYCRGKKRKPFLQLSNWISPYRAFFNRQPVEVIHIPVQIGPFYGGRKPVVTTMHDLQQLHLPEFFSSQERLSRALEYKRAIDESSHIIVSFAHVKEDIVRYFEVAESKVSVCLFPLGMNTTLKSEEPTPPLQLQKAYGLPQHFMLYPAATWPHKNHRGLLEAMVLLRDKGVMATLVCTGRQTDYCEELQATARRWGLLEQVKFLGMVSDADLISLYRTARLVVIPTRYEAGSGPLYEAMCYGAPVICSAVTSLPEAIGDSRFTFDPMQPVEMADLIERGLCDEDFRQANRENSRRRMEFHQQQANLPSFLAVYEQVLSPRNQGME